MIQGYPQENSISAGGWLTYGSCFADCLSCSQRSASSFLLISYSYLVGTPYEQWPTYFSEGSKLSGFAPYDREVGGSMLNVTGLNHFYYLCNFTDMRCKHSRVLSVIREQLHREPNRGDVYIVMSKNRRIVRMFAYDNRPYSLFEKKFVASHQFMKSAMMMIWYIKLKTEPENVSSYLKEAVNYQNKFWDEIFAYFKDSNFPIDNNLAERSIRKLTTQRNSMLHFGSDEGVEMAATYHSIISTVKMHGKLAWEFFGKFFTNIFNGCRDYLSLSPKNMGLVLCQ